METVMVIYYLQNMSGCRPSFKLFSPWPTTPLCDQYGDKLTFFKPMFEPFLEKTSMKRMFELIFSHPDIFSGFYVLDSPEFEKKYGMARRFVEKGAAKHVLLPMSN